LWKNDSILLSKSNFVKEKKGSFWGENVRLLIVASFFSHTPKPLQNQSSVVDHEHPPLFGSLNGALTILIKYLV